MVDSNYLATAERELIVRSLTVTNLLDRGDAGGAREAFIDVVGYAVDAVRTCKDAGISYGTLRPQLRSIRDLGQTLGAQGESIDYINDALANGHHPTAPTEPTEVNPDLRKALG